MGYKKNEGEDEGNKIIMMMLMHHHYYYKDNMARPIDYLNCFQNASFCWFVLVSFAEAG